MEVPDLLSGLPWWLRMLTPETTYGWIGVVAVIVCGLILVSAGKEVKKLQT